MTTRRDVLDVLATMEEPRAIRARADLRNVAWFRLLLLFYTVVNLIALAGAITGDLPVVVLVVAIAMALATILLFVLFGRLDPLARNEPRSRLDRLASYPARYLRGWILTFLIAEFSYLQLVVSEPDNLGWIVVFPILLWLFRFVASETILLYGAIFCIVAISTLVVASLLGSAETETLVIAFVWLSASLAVALGLTRRWRRRFLVEWSSVREQFLEAARMKQELEFAREIQLSMLPDAPPQVPWLDLATISLPASEVGGDYYDFFQLEDDKVALVIGDVAGHGLASGIVLSGVRSCLTLLADELEEPARVLTKLHGMVRQTSRHRMIVTLSILVIDRARRTASIASAGHPPVLLRNGDRVREIGTYAPPLGTGLLTAFESEEVELGDDFELVLQTDGVYEATDPNGNPFGFQRIAEVLQHSELDRSAATRDAILRNLWEFKGEAPQLDDITLIVARPESESWLRRNVTPIQSAR